MTTTLSIRIAAARRRIDGDRTLRTRIAKAAHGSTSLRRRCARYGAVSADRERCEHAWGHATMKTPRHTTTFGRHGSNAAPSRRSGSLLPALALLLALV